MKTSSTLYVMALAANLPQSLSKPSIPRRTLLSNDAGSSRQFGTALGRTGARLHGISPTASILRHRLASPSFSAGAATPLLSQVRFASTSPSDPLPSTPEAFDPNAFPATPFNLDGSSLLDIPERIGFLKELGLDYGWGPTAMMQWVLEHAHVTLGLPWWAAIPAVWLAVRVALFKPSLAAQEHSNKLVQLRKDPAYAAALANMMAAARGKTDRDRAEVHRARAQIYPAGARCKACVS